MAQIMVQKSPDFVTFMSNLITQFALPISGQTFLSIIIIGKRLKGLGLLWGRRQRMKFWIDYWS